ncbi:hypothetical protein ACH5RR_041149 [Cinchona calisaya]|uniref:Uncharacterized protein n=1 Tax=Cinchona calisaya TaxID=153742 RepID=A0ABD2XT28_9GENT
MNRRDERRLPGQPKGYCRNQQAPEPTKRDLGLGELRLVDIALQRPDIGGTDFKYTLAAPPHGWSDMLEVGISSESEYVVSLNGDLKSQWSAQNDGFPNKTMGDEEMKLSATWIGSDKTLEYASQCNATIDDVSPIGEEFSPLNIMAVLMIDDCCKKMLERPNNLEQRLFGLRYDDDLFEDHKNFIPPSKQEY